MNDKFIHQSPCFRVVKQDKDHCGLVEEKAISNSYFSFDFSYLISVIDRCTYIIAELRQTKSLITSKL